MIHLEEGSLNWALILTNRQEKSLSQLFTLSLAFIHLLVTHHHQSNHQTSPTQSLTTDVTTIHPPRLSLPKCLIE